MGQRGSSLNMNSDSQPSILPAIKTDAENEIGTRQESSPPVINPLNVGGKEKYYFFGQNNSQRKKFHYCGDCPYRACHRKPLMSHIKKLHPSSTTALPVSTLKALKKPKGKYGLKKNFTNKKIFNGRHNFIPKPDRTSVPQRMKRHEQLHHKKSVHHSTKRQRNVYYSHTNNSYSTSTNNQNEGWSWYYPPNGDQRYRIYYCRDCDYKAVRSNLLRHVMSVHPSSSSALPPKVPILRAETHQCADCEYETKNSGHFKRHRSFHDEKSAYQCHWCSFSVKSTIQLVRHVRRFHCSKLDKKDVIASENEYRFHCAHCPFKTKQKIHLEQHIVHHQDPPAEYQCHLCSFSVNFRGSLTLHLKLHYPEMDENNNDNIGDLLNTKKGRGNKRVNGSSLNSRRSLLSCQDCRLFKTSSHFTLKRHAKRAHPFSLSALPPLSIKRKKSGLKVTQKAQQPVEGASSKAAEGTREEWYVRPNGTRQNYIYCGDCDYRAIDFYKIERHARASHPYSTISAIPAHSVKKVRRHPPDGYQEPTENGLKLEKEKDVPIIEPTLLAGQKNQLHKCSECDFSTSKVGNMKGHKMSHQRNGKFKCSYCSFSSNFRAPIALHFKYGHHRNLKSARIQEVLSEASLKKQFGIKESSVVLHNILSPLIKVFNLENEEEDSQVADDEIQLLHIRLRTMKEKAHIAEEEVKDISSKKMNVQKRIDEIEKRRTMVDYLRLQHCNPPEKNLSDVLIVEEDGIFMEPVGEKVNYSEDEINLIDGQLNSLKEEEKNLAEDLEYAQESHFGVVQVIEALQYELDGYY